MPNGIVSLARRPLAGYRKCDRGELLRQGPRDAKAIYLYLARCTFQSKVATCLNRRGQRFLGRVEGNWKQAAIHTKMVGSVRPTNQINRSRDSSQTFVDRAKRLDLAGHTDSALDLIYDFVDERLRKGELSQLGVILAKLQVADFSTDILLGLLTATLPARSRLPVRQQLFRDVEQVLRERGELESGLMTGLE